MQNTSTRPRVELGMLLSEEARSALREAPLPERMELMHPVPMRREDPGPGWVFEPLFDGIRCLAIRDGDSLRRLDDGTRPLTTSIPEIERVLLEAGPGSFALDGEILEVDPKFEQGIVLPGPRRASDGRKRRKLESRFVAFDLLHCAGYDLRGVPLVERRHVLRALFRFSPTLMYARESIAPARIVFDQAEREAWRGVVAKRNAGRYDPAGEQWRVWRRRETPAE
jgi:bifunctional non-homologous end joining protein LigD